MTRRVLDLSTLSWQFGCVERQPFSAQPTDDRAAVAEWLPARVPGDVRADLIAAGRIPSLDTPEGIAAGAWVDQRDWWYRTTLPVTLADDELAVLEADGIDFYSAIWLDGQLLGTHAGMFSRQTVVLAPALKTRTPGLAPNRSQLRSKLRHPSSSAMVSGAACTTAPHLPGPHELAIRIWGAGALPRQPNPPWRRAARWLLGRVSPGVEYFPDRLLTPKAQFSFGWDFAPRVLSTGIWDEMRLVVTRGAYIEDVWVRAGIKGTEGSQGTQGTEGTEGTEEGDATGREGAVRVEVRLAIREGAVRPTQAAIVIEPENFSGPAHRETLDLNLSLNLSLNLDLPAMRRWWPWDQGEPCLYRVTVRLWGEEGVLDEVSRVVGVRSVRREPLAGGNGWRFVINGRPVALRGANWVPADVLPGRVTRADYERLLGQARAAGINFLRVWGGGVREKRAFWETCDRLGIMAWQEFPLACTFLDHYPRDRVSSADGDRPFRNRGFSRFLPPTVLPAKASSPGPLFASRHTSHREVHAVESLASSATSGASNYLDLLASEARGMVRALRNHPSLIAWCGGNEINPGRERVPLAAIRRVLADEDPDRPWLPASPAAGDVHRWDVWHGFAPWTALQKERAALVSEFGLQALPDPATVAEMFPDGAPRDLADPRWPSRKAQVAKLLHYAGPDAAGSLDRAIAATQRAQAAGLQAGLEAGRLRRADVIFWQFNEPWPAGSWAVVDRAGRPKAAYEMLRRCFQPVLIAARFPWRRYAAGDVFAAELWLVNDGPVGRAGCRAEAVLEGEIVWAQGGVALPAAGTARLGSFAVALAAAPQALTLRLACGDETLATNRYDLTVHLPGPMPLRQRFLRRLADALLGS